MDEGLEEDDIDGDYYSIILRVKGCVFPELQPNVRALRNLGLEAQNAEFCLRYEPENTVDRNAIAYYVKVLGAWLKLGYVCVSSIERVKKALMDHSFVSVRLDKIVLATRLHNNDSVFKCFCVLTKRGKWGPPNVQNVYNSQI